MKDPNEYTEITATYEHEGCDTIIYYDDVNDEQIVEVVEEE